MRNSNRWLLLSLPLLASGLTWSGNALSQDNSAGGGKIICWKDKSGKIAGCGDTVPPEYRDNATKELNKRGIVVNQTDAAMTPEQKKIHDAEQARIDEQNRLKEDQRRKDKALIDTFTTVDEIDDKRHRDLQLLESNIETLQSNLKNSADRQADIHARIDSYSKDGRPVPQALEDEAERVDLEKAKIDNQVAQKKQEIMATNQHYDELKRRFIELTGNAPPITPNTDPPAPAPASSK